MTIAALMLALAVVVAPSAPVSRLNPRRSPLPKQKMFICAVVIFSAATIIIVPMTAALAGAIVAATFTARRRQHIARTRRTEESAALQGALAVLVGELRVGAHPVAAVEAAATEVTGTESTGSVATSLRMVAARARLGADVAGGLRSVGAASALPAQWERVAVCWQLAQSRGISLATLMQAAHRDIVERGRFESRVTAGMAGARATGGVLAGLPLLGAGLGQLIGAEPVRFLMSGGAGGWLLVIGSILACCGLLWSDRITNRVLT